MYKPTFFAILLFTSVLASVHTAVGQSNEARDHRDEPASANIPDEGTVVAMEIYGNKPVIEVNINGKGPFKMFLDTGAGATVINKELADQLNLGSDGTVKVGDPKDPQGVTAERRKIDTFRIGGAQFSGFDALSWDRTNLYKPGSPQGVVGMPLFRKLLLTIDYPAAKVMIQKGGLSSGPNVIDYQPGIAGLFKVPMTVAGKEMTATIDSGSMSGISFPESFKEMLPLADKPVEVGRGRTVAGEAIVYGAKLNGSIRICGTTLVDPNIRFFGRLTDANIGYEFLRSYALTIDQANKRIRFTPASDSVAAISFPAKPGGDLKSYAGTYGIRNITVENGHLVLQRMSGPQGAGPKIPLDEVSQGEYALPGTKEVRVKFVREASGVVKALMVLNPQGQWETADRGTP